MPTDGYKGIVNTANGQITVTRSRADFRLASIERPELAVRPDLEGLVGLVPGAGARVRVDPRQRAGQPERGWRAGGCDLRLRGCGKLHWELAAICGRLVAV